MPEVTIMIGGRGFDVSCQEGEQPFLESAARLLDAEAQVLLSQVGRMPEPRMLLMAGLMLADKTAGLEDQVVDLREKLASQDALIEELKSRPAAEPNPASTEIPEETLAALEDLVEQAEDLAQAARG